MNINTAALIYFSPTGSTKKILDSITKRMGVSNIKLIDLTSPAARKEDLQEIKEDVVIIGSPVYKNMIPIILNSYLAGLKGDRRPVVLVTCIRECGRRDCFK